MLALALTASLLAASTDASVVVARRIGLEAKKGTELAQQLVTALQAKTPLRLGTVIDVAVANERLAAAGFPDTSVCNGAASCVASLARVGGFGRLVALQLVKLGGDVAVDASVVDGETGKALAAVTRTIKLKNAADELAALAGELLAKVPASDAPAVEKPEPVSVVTTPPPAPEPEPIVETKPPPPGLSTARKVSLGLGGAAVVAVGVGVGLGVSASGQASMLSVRDPSYDAKVAAAKGTALGADLSYGAAGALAVTAIVLWVVGGQ